MPEQMMDSPVPQIIEDSLPVVPQESVQNRTTEQIVDCLRGCLWFLHHRSACRIVCRNRLWISLCLGSWRPPWDVMRATPQEHVQNRMQERVLNRSQEQIVDEPVSQIMDVAVEVLHAPQECVQNRTLEHIVDVPVPPVLEVDSPQECVQNRTLEHIGDVPVPSVLEGVVEVDAPLSQLVEEVVQAVPPDSELDVHVTPEFDSPEELDARADRVLGRWTFEYPWVLEEALVAEVDDDDGCVEPSRFSVGFPAHAHVPTVPAWELPVRDGSARSLIM